MLQEIVGGLSGWWIGARLSLWGWSVEAVGVLDKTLLVFIPGKTILIITLCWGWGVAQLAIYNKT